MLDPANSINRSMNRSPCSWLATAHPFVQPSLGARRRRTNVWTHSGGDRGPHRRTGRKPVKLLIDILKDCSARGDIVLDPFAGSGTTMIAAERTDRRAYLSERDPRWCDVILRRWEALTKVPACLAESSATFAEVAKERSSAGTEGQN